jgi:hypothetical protein
MVASVDSHIALGKDPAGVGVGEDLAPSRLFHVPLLARGLLEKLGGGFWKSSGLGWCVVVQGL